MISITDVYEGARCHPQHVLTTRIRWSQPGPGSSQNQWLGGLTAARLIDSLLVYLTTSLINFTFKGLKI